jgi:programmed cell death protein 4
MDKTPPKETHARSTSNDVNRDGSGGDGNATATERSIVLEIITEFIESGELKDALQDIKKRREIDGAEFVKRCLIFGIERKAYERELISQLLSGAYSIFQNKEMPDGYETVLDRLPDLSLDVPDAPEALGKFIARAIFDEVLPPVFLKQAKVNNPKANGSLSLAQELYDKDRKLLQHIWGGGDLSSVRRLRKAVDALLADYLENKEIEDASTAILALSAPTYNSQVVRQALTIALEKNSPQARKDILELISVLHKRGQFLPYDVHHGFELVWRKIHDIKLDVPNAPEMLAELTDAAKQQKLISSKFNPSTEQKQQKTNK